MGQRTEKDRNQHYYYIFLFYFFSFFSLFHPIFAIFLLKMFYKQISVLCPISIKIGSASTSRWVF